VLRKECIEKIYIQLSYQQTFSLSSAHKYFRSLFLSLLNLFFSTILTATKWKFIMGKQHEQQQRQPKKVHEPLSPHGVLPRLFVNQSSSERGEV
jgi:hypothetical protein